MMKTIFLIKDEMPFWEEIVRDLKTVNAKVFLFDKSILQGISEKAPDIVIAGERSYKETAALFQDIPKLIITEGKITESRYKDVYFLSWPEGKDAFLEITARLLYISERRIFRTIIRITPKGKNETFFGRSLDFSLSGMAFKVERALNIGDLLRVSLFIPNSDEQINIGVEVMRSSIDPDDGSTYYGARFINIEKGVKDALEDFIKKIK